MRLINLETQQLEEVLLEDVPLMSRFTAGAPSNVRAYAILSHTWTAGQEVSFLEYNVIQGEPMTPRAEELRLKSGYAKIQAFLAALADQRRAAPWLTFVKWAWIDTCCIDKSSSADLSEAINSMYQWYRNAAICMAHLEDINASSIDRGRNVSFLETPAFTDGPLPRWFSRGWTLQELIAPRELYFYDRTWHLLGGKSSGGVPNVLEKITAIPREVLVGEEDCSSFPVAQRMRWASGRTTTRREDEAYCLLGIFDVNIPLLYGEGSKAFIRLQEAIIRTTNDHTLFAWTRAGARLTGSGVLATSVRDFQGCPPLYVARTSRNVLDNDQRKVLLAGHDELPLHYHLTNTGIQIWLPFADAPSHWSPDKSTACVLGCRIGLLDVATSDFNRNFWHGLARDYQDATPNHDMMMVPDHQYGCIYLRRRREDGIYVRTHVDQVAWMRRDEILSIFPLDRLGDLGKFRLHSLYLQAVDPVKTVLSLGSCLP